MVLITISGIPTGRKALLYERRGRQGRRTYVPTYAAWATCGLADKRLDFAVVRDTSPHVFGEPDSACAEHGECPPSAASPYFGFIREDGPNGFRIELYEEHVGRSTLIGRGAVPRTNVQIHVGAAASHGCILVAGRRRWYYRHFVSSLRDMLRYTDMIRVVVLPKQSARRDQVMLYAEEEMETGPT